MESGAGAGARRRPWRRGSVSAPRSRCGSIRTSIRRRTPTSRPACRSRSSAWASTEARRLYVLAASDPALDVKGVAMHIGSQITDGGAVPRRHPSRPGARFATCGRQGIRDPATSTWAAGWASSTTTRSRPHPDAYGAAVKRALRCFEGEVLLEPGRVLVGQRRRARHARPLPQEERPPRVRGGRRRHERPGAARAVRRPPRHRARRQAVRRSGPSATWSARSASPPTSWRSSRRLPEVTRGDLLCVRSAGAYGFAMSSNYNARPRAAEVLVDGDMAYLVRQRESWPDLVRGERARPPGRRFGRAPRVGLDSSESPTSPLQGDSHALPRFAGRHRHADEGRSRRPARAPRAGRVAASPRAPTASCLAAPPARASRSPPRSGWRSCAPWSRRRAGGCR